jgi:hypothetical protein
MELSEYFEKNKGFGILATADSSGIVDAAVYARPHVIDEKTVAFIMADRLTHANLQINASAVYLYKEEGEHYSGKRLFLTKNGEEENQQLVDEICRRCDYSMHSGNLTRYIVFFTVDKVLPLIGSGE